MYLENQKTMKKIVFILLMNAIFLNVGAQAFDKGTQVGSIGVGVGGSFGSYTTSSSTPAISLQYERGIWEISDKGVVSLGGYLGYRSFKYEGPGYRQSWNYSIIGVRSAFHYKGFDIEKLDPYAGLMLGYYNLNYKYDGPYASILNGSYGSTVGFSGYAGARYYLADKIGVFGELGFGISYFTLGAVYKF